MKTEIMQLLAASLEIKKDMVSQCLDDIINIAKEIETCLQNCGKVLIFGNGGSAADAQHLAAEFVNRFRINRRPLAAIALTTDSSVITSIANDFGYDLIFEKQVQALGYPGDIAIGISTSGNSANVITGLKAARAQSLVTVGFTGPKGQIGPLCDHLVWSNSSDTPRIQEGHITIGHIICELVEKSMFTQQSNL